ncbi:MAG: Uncharacterised protein [Alphaproteobacteria bacterium]|nr:MAG: Uncharacterised protein [Alphaproteobacteria bacterium]
MDMTALLRPLTLITGLSLVLALAALIGERPVNAVAPPQLLLADYAAQLDKAQKLEVTHGRGLSGARSLHISRTDTGWTLDERWNYPANDELVNETLLALADLKAVQARTAQVDWHRALGLVVPEDLGAAVRFRVTGKQGAILTSLLLGKEQQSESEATQEVRNYGPELRQFYVRREDSAQSWLARGRLPRNPDMAAWIDPALPRHDLDKLTKLRFGTGDDAFAALRVGSNWSLGGTQDWLDRFAALRPDDVARAEAINFDTARPFTLQFEDGLSLTYENVGAATVIWSRISARANADASGDIKALATRLNNRFNGWALRFSAERTPLLLPAKRDLDG